MLRADYCVTVVHLAFSLFEGRNISHNWHIETIDDIGDEPVIVAEHLFARIDGNHICAGLKQSLDRRDRGGDDVASRTEYFLDSDDRDIGYGAHCRDVFG